MGSLERLAGLMASLNVPMANQNQIFAPCWNHRKRVQQGAKIIQIQGIAQLDAKGPMPTLSSTFSPFRRLR